MRSWKRLTLPQACGACGAVLLEGATVQVLQVHGMQRDLYRCAGCAVGEAPPQMTGPVEVTPAQLQGRLATIASVAVQFQRPERKPVLAVPKKKAYRGGDAPPTQPGMLGDLPVRTRR